MSHFKKAKIMNFFGGSKAESELSTSDKDPLNPAVFPDEICQLILSYLPVADLLSASLTSKLWLEAIGASLTFKKRVSIKIHAWHELPPHDIANSTRSFEILHLSHLNMGPDKLHCLRGKNWRRVALNIGKVKSQKRLLELMQTFGNVKDLKILSTNIRQLNTEKKAELPELENFTLSDVTLDLFDLFIAHQPSLRRCSMRFVSCDILSPRRVGEALVEFLKLNEQLKELEVNFLVTNDLFLVNVGAELALKLRKLTIGLNETSVAVRGNIEEFLRLQGESVECLKLIFHQKLARKGPNEWGYWERRGDADASLSSEDVLIVYRAWNSLTALKHLSLRFLQDSSELDDHRELLKNLKRNVNVTSLSIQFMNVAAPSTLPMDLMKLSPNLHSLYVSKLTPAMVRYAAIHLKVLRQLTCFTFEGECNQEYNELKASRTDINNIITIVDRCAFG